jgi:hypothetical protein
MELPSGQETGGLADSIRMKTNLFRVWELKANNFFDILVPKGDINVIAETSVRLGEFLKPLDYNKAPCLFVLH